VAVIVARNRCHWVPIILGPVSSPRAWEGVVDSFSGSVERFGVSVVLDFPDGCAQAHPPDVAPEPARESKIRSRR
jgi:hypothetical protein